MWKKKKQNQKEELFVRNKLRFSILSFLFLCTVPVIGSHTFTFNKNLLVAQQQNYELRLGRAYDYIRTEQEIDPENSAIHYLLHFNAFLKAFVSEEQSDYATYRRVQDKALFHFEKLPDSSPYKKFAQSEVYFYSATLKAKFDELYSAARDVNRANTLIEANHKEFPEFVPNNKTRGIIKVYLSTVPDNYEWIIKMLGIEGDLSEGLRLLKDVTTHKNDTTELAGIAKEAAYLYSFSLLHVAKQGGKAWAETLKCTEDYKTNLLSCFFRTNAALKLNRNETAINILSSRPKSDEFTKFYFLNYQLGVATLNKLDVSAIDHFNEFYNNFKGRNYIKSCLQKMSWYYVIHDDPSKAVYYKDQVLVQGYSLNEEDKQALRYTHKTIPESALLEARLLYDGGYFEQASKSIHEIDGKSLPSTKLKAEFCYRAGRIAEKMGKIENALKLYEACSLFAIDGDEYYGAYASIYLGDYYLNSKDMVLANKFYKRALGFKKNKEYTQSIEQRAKAGLKRIE
ncbi:MAG: hypothetical protein COA58_05045 [Bacteroidetes bacterium]|nr:MAG: hypothetical protein COA58_05045 [Bacteroidota bacterium]